VGVGTASYMAPEAIRPVEGAVNSGEMLSKLDVFAFAITFWEVMTRKSPFDEGTKRNYVAVAFGIVSGDRPDLGLLPPCVSSSAELMSLVERAWAPRHYERPRMLDWLAVLDGRVASLRQLPVALPNTRVCEMCLQAIELALGALCDSTQHFTCYECVADRIDDDVGSSKVRSDGALCCKGCGGLYPFEAFRRSLDAATFQTWTGALLQGRERELYAAIQSEQQRQMAQAEAQRHMQHIQNEILIDKCPRCSVAFEYVMLRRCWQPFNGCSA
jgi:hypothetical protein